MALTETMVIVLEVERLDELEPLFDDIAAYCVWPARVHQLTFTTVHKGFDLFHTVLADGSESSAPSVCPRRYQDEQEHTSVQAPGDVFDLREKCSASKGNRWIG